MRTHHIVSTARDYLQIPPGLTDSPMTLRGNQGYWHSEEHRELVFARRELWQPSMAEVQEACEIGNYLAAEFDVADPQQLLTSPVWQARQNGGVISAVNAFAKLYNRVVELPDAPFEADETNFRELLIYQAAEHLAVTALLDANGNAALLASDNISSFYGARGIAKLFRENTKYNLPEYLFQKVLKSAKRRRRLAPDIFRIMRATDNTNVSSVSRQVILTELADHYAETPDQSALPTPTV